MNTDVKVNKPEPIAINKNLQSFKQGTDVGSTIEDLIQGKSILISAFYNDGVSLLQEIHKYLKQKLKGILNNSIKWNFTKFLIGPDGTPIKRFGSKTEPKDIIPFVRTLLMINSMDN